MSFMAPTSYRTSTQNDPKKSRRRINVTVHRSYASRDVQLAYTRESYTLLSARPLRAGLRGLLAVEEESQLRVRVWLHRRARGSPARRDLLLDIHDQRGLQSSNGLRYIW